nr:hypothetical protein [Streptacidiphilus jeojiense]
MSQRPVALTRRYIRVAGTVAPGRDSDANGTTGALTLALMIRSLRLVCW